MSDLTVPTEKLDNQETVSLDRRVGSASGSVGSVNLGGVVSAQPKWGDIAQNLSNFTAQIAQASDEAMAMGAYNEMQKKLGDLDREYANSPGRGSREELQKQQAAANKIVADFRSALSQLSPMSRVKFGDEANKYINRFRDSTLNNAAKKADDLAKLNNAALIANAAEDYTLAYSLNPNSKQAEESRAALMTAIDRQAEMFGLTKSDPEYQNMTRNATSKVAAQATYQALAERSLERAKAVYNHAVKNKLFTAEDRARSLMRITDEENRRAAKAAAAAAAAARAAEREAERRARAAEKEEARKAKQRADWLMALSTGRYNPAQLDLLRKTYAPKAKEIVDAQYERDLEAYNQQLEVYKKSSFSLPGTDKSFSIVQQPVAPKKPIQADYDIVTDSLVKKFIDTAQNQLNINSRFVGDITNKIQEIPVDERKSMDEDELLLATLSDPSMLPTIKSQLKDALGSDSAYNKFMERSTYGAELTELQRDDISRQVDALPIETKLEIVSSKIPEEALRDAGINAPTYIVRAETARLVKEIDKESSGDYRKRATAAENFVIYSVIGEVIQKKFRKVSGPEKGYLTESFVLQYGNDIKSKLYEFIHSHPKLKKYSTDAERLKEFMENGEIKDEFQKTLDDYSESLIKKIDKKEGSFWDTWLTW